MPAQPSYLRAAPDVRGRIMAALRLGLYVLLAVAFAGVAIWALQAAFHLHVDPGVLPSIGTLLGLQSLLVLTTVLAPTAILVGLTRDKATAFGWGTGHRVRHLLIGAATGLGVMAVLVGSIAVLHGASLRLTMRPPGEVLGYALGYLLVFTLVAISEEGLLRGYPLVALSRAVSFWPAALLSSLGFALLHAGHKDETLAGLLQASLAGLVLAYSFSRSGGLWFAWGWHAAWDWAETFVFGMPDSGLPARGALFSADLHGPTWLSGGSAGPEGSWLVLPCLALVAIIIRLTLTPSTAVIAKG